MSLINQLKKPIRDLFVRLSNKQIDEPQFLNVKFKDCSVLLLSFADEKTDLDEIVKLLPKVQGVFKEVKIIIYTHTVLSDLSLNLELIQVSPDDFTIGGRLNKKINRQLGADGFDILVGLNYTENRWYQQLIGELPARFKAGVQMQMKPSNYHFVLCNSTPQVKISDNFEQIIDYLRTLKIHQ